MTEGGHSVIALDTVPGVLQRWTVSRSPMADADTARVAGHLLARECAGRVTGLDPHCLRLDHVRMGAGRGRPVITGRPTVQVSVAHAGDAVAAAASMDGRIGVDVETLARVARCREGIASLLSDADRASIEDQPNHTIAAAAAWVLRECLVKCGLGPLDDPALSAEGPPGARGVVTRRRSGLLSWWQIADDIVWGWARQPEPGGTVSRPADWGTASP